MRASPEVSNKKAAPNQGVGAVVAGSSPAAGVSELAALRLAAIVNNSDDAIIGKDLDGIITSWNQGAEKIFGYTAGEMIGTSIMRLIPPDRQAEENHILGQIRRGESVRRFETLRQTKDGRLIDISVTASPIKDSSGQVVGVSKMAQDITREKQAEAALRRSEARLDFALQTSHTGAWELSLQDNTAHRTLIHDRIFGYDTLLPRWSYEVFLEHVLPEDRAEVDRRFRAATAARADWDFECRIRRADGETRWIWAAGGHEQGAAGEPMRLSGIVQDITERKRVAMELQVTHEKFCQLLVHSPAVIYSLKVEGETVTPQVVSENMIRLTGYTVEEGASYDWWAEHLHPDDREEQFANIGVTLRGEGLRAEYRLRHKDGHYIWVEDSRKTVRDAGGQPVSIAGVWTNITVRKLADEEIRMQLHELQRWHEAMLGREERVLELKNEVNELLARQKLPARYAEPSAP